MLIDTALLRSGPMQKASRSHLLGRQGVCRPRWSLRALVEGVRRSVQGPIGLRSRMAG